jgi:two-component system, OmpR family, sensor histidine kinase MprB
VSLRGRLTLFTALAVAVAVALASIIVYALVRHQLLGQIDDTLRERAGPAAVIAGQVSPGSGPPAVGVVSRTPFRIGTEALPAPGRPKKRRHRPAHISFRIPAPPGEGFQPVGQLIGPHGIVAPAGNSPSIPVSGEAERVAAGDRGPLFENATVNGADFRVYTVPAGPDRALQIARPLSEVNGTLSDLRLILVLVTIGGMALAAGLGLLVARGALAPAAAVSAGAEEVARTRDLTRRIEVRGSDELGRLAASFNQMMEALEASEAARRQLIAEASHELRTPLATLRTNIETLSRARDLDPGEGDRIVADLEAELEDLGGLVADVIELARGPDGPPLAEDEVRLDEVVAAVAERARRRARELRFDTKVEPWLVRGDPGRLDRAIWNLIDNAIKWSPDGSAVEIGLAGGVLRVRDHGPGFAPDDLPRAFDRFYRSDDARGKPGSGLGLAIAKRIAEEHGGSARAANADDGGAVVELELPGEPPPAEAVP